MAAKQKTGIEWLHERMSSLGFGSLEEAALACDLNRGTLYRYFMFETRPSIDVLPQLCLGLRASPQEVLIALGIQMPKNSSK